MTTDGAIQLLQLVGQKIRQGEYAQAVIELRRLMGDEEGITHLAKENMARVLDGLLANQPPEMLLKNVDAAIGALAIQAGED